MDPVKYLTLEDFSDVREALHAGFTEPGWYFWDETEAYCHGPYGSDRVAYWALKNYCKKLGGTPLDPVNPSHYKRGGYELADILEAWELGPHEWNAVAYIMRAKFKGRELEDLKKASWYISRRISMIGKGTEKNGSSPQL